MRLSQFVLLALAVYRLTRLFGWDDLPPVARARAWLLRERCEPRCPSCLAGRDDYEQRNDVTWVGLERCPNCSSTESPTFETYYGRPLLAELFHCPFCLGWWVGLPCYLAWAVAPHLTLLVLAPFALSGAVGLIAKNLDP